MLVKLFKSNGKNLIKSVSFPGCNPTKCGKVQQTVEKLYRPEHSEHLLNVFKILLVKLNVGGGSESKPWGVLNSFRCDVQLQRLC